MLADEPIESTPASSASWLRTALLSPLLLLSCAILACGLLLTRPLVLPLGAMYWDLALYLDAANRIAAGQVPLIDFLTPVGPLGYWLFAWLGEVFTRSQPLLLAQWSLFVVTAPPLVLILREVDRRSRATAFGLLLPYLVFQILPINVEQYSFYPGMDGFGIYNRQVSIVLYVLVAALVFLRDRRLLTGILVWTLLALLLIKITGLLAGGLVVAFALAAGRLDWRQSAIAAGVAALLLAALEIATGIVGAYVESILALVSINSGLILPRFLHAASLHLDIVAAGGALMAVLILLGWREIAGAAAAFAAEPSRQAFQRLIDRDVAWLGVVMAAGLFFETQNTGGQAFIFIWPVLLSILAGWLGSGRRGAVVVLALLAATAIPPVETVLQRAGRTLLAQTGYLAVPNLHLGRLGLVSQHPEVIERAARMQEIQISRIEAFRAIAEKKMLPSETLYSARDFQVGWLMAIDAGIAAIREHEAKTGTRFETIMSLNFANPFPYLMERTGVRHIAIGADPFRAVPEPSEAALAAVAEADLILYPLCPVTVANRMLRTLYAAAMSGREEITLGSCWKGYVRS